MQLTSVVACLRVFLPLVLSSVSAMHARSGWDQEIDLAIAEYSTFLPSKTPGLLSMKSCPINFAAYDWIWAGSIYLRINLTYSVFCHIINKHTSNSATGSHACSCHHTAPPCFTDDVVCFGSWAVPSLPHTFFFPLFGYRLILISANQRMLFKKLSGFFRCVWQSLIWPCLHLVVNPLYLLSIVFFWL